MSNSPFGHITLLWCAFMACTGVAIAQDDIMPVEKLGSGINSPMYDEASPVIAHDGKTLYFTRSGSPEFDRTLINNGQDLATTLDESQYKLRLAEIFKEIAAREIVDPYTSSFNQDIWIARTIDQPFDYIEHPPFPVNNALPNSVVSASLDSQTLVVINQFYSDGSMFEGFSSIEIGKDGDFGFPQPIHIYEFYNVSEDVNLALSRKGHTMVLSLKRKDSQGHNDLYVSFKVDDNLWSVPKNIGPDINTPYQESTPFITHDGRRMYFSSNRPGSVGGMDIWVSERLDFTWKKWSPPKRLKSPINSEFDDSQAYIDQRNSHLYFASRRDGSSDIFRMPLQPKPQLKKPLNIIGKLINAKTGELIRGEVFYGPTSVKSYLEYYHTYSGHFEIELTEYEVYKFFARKSGFEPAGLHFDARLAEKADLDVHEVVLYLNPVEGDVVLVSPGGDIESTQTIINTHSDVPRVGDKISFYNIYFERGKSVVLPASFTALDELVAKMEKYPTLEIQIEGHTDNVGVERELMELSWLRAKAVKEYLGEHGVLASRVGVIGYGPQKPVATNSTEENRQKNRRVEVRIISK